MIELFLKFLIAHLLGDFVLQPNSWVKDKKENKIKSQYLYFHILVHFVLLLVLTAFQSKYIVGILLICALHFVIDCFKIYNESSANKTRSFFLDQIFHIITLLVAVRIYVPFKIDLNWFYQKNILVLITCVLLVTYVAAIVLRVILDKWNPNKNINSNQAGMYIGILERLFIFFFVVMNFWQGIGFLLAAKSIFRFGTLKNKREVGLTEYILIGTLMSFAIGISLGLLYNFLIDIE